MKLTMKRPRGFQLAAASDFFPNLTLAFRLDGTFEPVAVRFEEAGDTVVLHVAGSQDSNAIERQVARILGLEGDADAWKVLGERDGLVGKLKSEFPGFFTATKSSPYDAATWAAICPRMSITQAARVKLGIARELGDVVTLDGAEFSVFPSPAALAQLRKFPGLSDEKIARLRAVAEAAKTGKLDTNRLRSMSEKDALRELQEIRGIGPWGAAHIYCRGAAPLDALPTIEPRVLHGFADAAGVAAPTAEEFEKAADAWRPFRMWVCVLLSRHLARAGKWRAARKRAS